MKEFTVLYQAIVAGIFITWILATCVCQFKETKLSSWLKKFDTFSLIPLWTFFAPNPGTKDYHLLYREKSRNGEVSDWIEIDIQENRRFWSFLWNPRKRTKKVLSDIIQGLVPMIPSSKKKSNSIMLSLPYMLVLNVVGLQKAQTGDHDSRQFVLAESEGYANDAPPNLILLSPYHPVSG